MGIKKCQFFKKTFINMTDKENSPDYSDNNRLKLYSAEIPSANKLNAEVVRPNDNFTNVMSVQRLLVI